MAARQSSLVFQGYGHRFVKLNSSDAPIVYDISSNFKGEPESVTSDLETSRWCRDGVKACEYRIYRCLSFDIVCHQADRVALILSLVGKGGGTVKLSRPWLPVGLPAGCGFG